MKEIKFKPMQAEDIEVRAAQVKANGCSLLLYKNARVDMRQLDEVVGAMNWKRSHDVINGNLFCTVSIYNENTKEWVSKQDVGVESYTEKEKGQASDAFKRACFNWGIGRELYTAPFIWVNLNSDETFRSNSGSVQLKCKFHVSEIAYTDNKISKLVIVDDGGNVRYTYPSRKSAGKSSTATLTDEIRKEVAACKNEEELRKVYFAHEDLKNCTEFITLVNNKKNELKK